MTQEDKKLLLADLAARIPYVVKCHFKYGSAEGDVTLDCIDNRIARFEYEWYRRFHVSIDADYIKPYLRPMSSMTEEEAKELSILYGFENILSIKITDEYIDVIVDDGFCSTETRTIWYDDIISSIEIFDWLNAHHFDYRGLILMGLALKAPEGMYINKQN